MTPKRDHIYDEGLELVQTSLLSEVILEHRAD